MFTKKLAPDGRLLMMTAANEAALLQAEQVGGEHLLLACLAFRGSPPEAYLAHSGIDRERVTTLLAITAAADSGCGAFDDDDAQALAGLGIDLPQVLSRLEENLGSAARPTGGRPRRPGPPRRFPHFADCAKSSVKRAVLEAATLRSKTVEPAHLLLAVLREPAPCCAGLVAELEADYDGALRFMFDGAR